jgi:hypothetical protein
MVDNIGGEHLILVCRTLTLARRDVPAMPSPWDALPALTAANTDAKSPADGALDSGSTPCAPVIRATAATCRAEAACCLKSDICNLPRISNRPHADSSCAALVLEW